MLPAPMRSGRANKRCEENLFILYQKKIEAGHERKKPIYEYCIQKNKTEGSK